MIRDAPKLIRARRLDSIRLDRKDTTYFTAEGYLVDHPILTSCGIFEYKNPDGSVRRELRLPEHVFKPESLKSYRGKPVIITHDAGVVDKDNVDREQIGTILSDGYREGENVRAEVIIHNTDAMRDCGLRELSLGYNLELVEEPGEWNGQPYDAIQTNIIINHLALVASARAGEQARLNIDGSDNGPELKGGKVMANENSLTPEQLEEAITLWKAKNADGDSEPDAPNEDSADAPAVDVSVTDGNDAPQEPDAIESKLASVRERRDRRNADGEPEDMKGAKKIIAQQNDDLDTLSACLETLLAEKAAKNDDSDEPANADYGADCVKDEDDVQEDSSDDESRSMNADSADEIVRQRLSVCRVGDKLHLDGLENKSILDGKKAIIAKVMPNVRLDGRSATYVNCMYDIAVEQVNRRKDADYQRKQMAGGHAPKDRRNDGDNGVSMAASARLRMLEREGGNQ